MLGSVSYWVERGKNEYYRDTHRPLHQKIIYNRYFLDRIDKQIYGLLSSLDFDNVLEIGCGWGFMSKKILDRYASIRAYWGFDVSKEQLKEAYRHISDKRFIAYESSIENNAWHKNRYDLVFEATVFIHLPPNEIEFAIQKAFDSSRKYVLSWDWYDKERIGANIGDPPYCFNHDYETLYRNAGASKVDVIPVKHSFYFLAGWHIPKISNLFQYEPCLILAYKK